MKNLNRNISSNESFLFYSNDNGYVYQDSADFHNQTSNYNLCDSPNITLNKRERINTNAQAKSLLNKPIPALTKQDKKILSQYTGFGGINKNEFGSLSQFYTDYSTVRVIFKAIEDSSFKYHNILEPAAGAGGFVGNKPYKNWTTIELDYLNYQVLNRLYPKALNYNLSFEDFNKKGFDLIISNIPFLESRGLRVNKNRPDIKALHDFYFLHALDLLNDNGLLVFITSIYTMDSRKKCDIRKEIVSKSDLLNAFRLPVKHFAKSAHTDTPADIIILQKRPLNTEISEEQKNINESFINVTTKNDLTVNNFYLQNYSNFLGTPEVHTNRFGKKFAAPTGETQLNKITFELQRKYIAENIQKIQIDNTIPLNSKEFEEWEKDNTEYLIKKNVTITDRDGKGFNKIDDNFYDSFFYTQNESEFIYYALYKEIKFDDIRGIARLYNKVDNKLSDQILILHRILNLADKFQNSNYSCYTESAEKLVNTYRNKYKISVVNDRKLKSFFKKYDALSFYYDLSTLFNSEFKLSNVFFEQVKYENSGIINITKNSTLQEKALANEDNKGFLNINESSLYLNNNDVPKLLNSGYSVVNISESEITLQNNILYYSGRIYVKIEKAEAVINDDSIYKKQIKEQVTNLKNILPEPKTIENINFKGNENWIRKHLEEILNIKQKESSRTSQNEWYISGRYSSPFDYNEITLYEKYLNNRSLVRREEKEAAILYLQRVSEAEEKIIEIKEKLKQFILNNAELCTHIEYEYNKKFRSYVKPDYLKAKYLIKDILDEVTRNKPVNPKTGKTISLRDNQISWIIQAYYEGKGINAHDVGGGKTLAAIVLARLLKKRGIANKPLFTVPAKTIRKWESEIKILFPNAGIINLGNLPKNKRTELLLKTAKTNSDYILISHEGFKQIELDSSSELLYFDKVVKEHIDNENSEGRNKLLLDDKINDFREIVINRPRDQYITLDNLGIDSIFADEAHNFKNIAVRQELVKSGLGISFAFNNNDNVSLKSARSYDFRFKCNYIADKNNGNNIFLLTATPTPNKPLEVYTMLRHLDSDILNEYGIYSDLQFSNAFFEFGTVKDIRNSEKTKSILSKIINAVELRNIINRFIDKKNIFDLNILIPEENIINHYLDKSINYELVEGDLKDRQDNLSSSIEAGDDTHIAIYTNGRNASIDPRLYYGAHAIANIDDRTFCNSDDKIELTIDLISKKILDNPKCGQLLFLDVAGYSKVEFGCMDEDLHREIKRLVIERTGIEKKQIAIMTGQYITNLKTGNDIRTPSGDKKDKLKQDISDSFNSGEIKLIIGSTQSMGEGMDLQINTTDVYNLDFPYNSAALRQRKGRAIRYGNINGSVNVHYFFMKGTFDSLSYDLISKKKGWNSALWDKEATEEISTREEMQGGSMPSSEQIQIELESDPLIKEMLKKEYSYKLMLEEKEAVFISLHRSKTKLDSKKRFLSSLLETKNRKEALIKEKQNESNLNAEKVIKLLDSYSKHIEVLNEKIDFTLKQISNYESKITQIEKTYDELKINVTEFRIKNLDKEDEKKAA